jgi:2,4-diketo-3-deoxy-L-fuconate hydrolase
MHRCSRGSSSVRAANYRKHVIDLILDQPVSVDVSVPMEDRRRHAEALMDHRAAHGKPFAFLQTRPRCVIGPRDEDVILPIDMQQPDWELELAAIIGKARAPGIEAAGRSSTSPVTASATI